MAPRATYTPVPLPSRGLDLDSSTDEMHPNTARVLENLLLDRAGLLIPRGPMRRVEDRATGWEANARFFGGRGWVFDNKIAYSAHDGNTAARKRQYWRALVQPVSAETDLARIADNAAGTITNLVEVYNADTDTVTAINIGAGNDNGLGLRGVAYRGSIYGPAYAADPASTGTSFDGGVHYLRRLIKWDGGTVAGSFVTLTAANAPTAAIDVAVHYERLFALGGRSPNGAETLHWDELFYTNPGEDPALLASWRDANAQNNRIQVGRPDANDPGVALAQVGGDLLVFKRRSVWVLKGYSTDTWQVKQVTAELGCIDPRSVVELGDAVYFMSQQGFMRYDGVELENVSGNLSKTLTSHASTVVGDESSSTFDGGFVCAGPLPRGHIMLRIGAHRVTSAATLDTKLDWLLFDTTRGTWITLDTAVDNTMAGGGPIQTVRAPRVYLGVGNRSIYDMSVVPSPELRNFLPDPLFVDLDGSTKVLFDAVWTSRNIRLSSPELRAQVLQWIIELHQLNLNAPIPLWTVTVAKRDSGGITSGTAVDVPAPTETGMSNRVLQRHVQDDHGDTWADVVVTVQNRTDWDPDTVNIIREAHIRSFGVLWNAGSQVA